MNAWAVLLLAWAALSPQLESLEMQKAAVVRLTIHRPMAADETAAAMFVGKDQQNAFFITACHAIVELCKEPPGKPVSSIDLQFHNSATRFEAFIFERFNAGLDLAVVRTPVGSLPPGIPTIPVGDAASAAPIRVVGHPAAGGWSTWSGVVQNENGANADVQRFITNRDFSLAGGYSGGPVFDSRGAFLGMHIETTESYGVAVKSADVLRQLKAWNVPTTNLGPAAAGDLQADRDAISKVLDNFVNAYSRRDKDALWTIWPNAPADRKKAIESSFENARSIALTLSQVTFDEMSRQRATVRARFLQEFVSKTGAELKQPGTYVFRLEKKDGAWIIGALE